MTEKKLHIALIGAGDHLSAEEMLANTFMSVAFAERETVAF